MQQRNKLISNYWITYPIKIENLILTNDLIVKSLNQFWLEIVSNLSLNQYILIQFKIVDTTGEIKSISYVQLVNKTELNSLSKIFIEFWDIKSENYHLMQISDIIFMYKILPLSLDIKESKLSVHKKRKFNVKNNKISSFKFNGNNLPCTMDFSNWGNTHIYNDYSKAIVFKSKTNSEYHISIYDNYTLVDLKCENKVILSFKDSMLDVNDLSTFKREFKNQSFIFENGNLKLKTIKRNTRFITSLKPSISLNEHFITMDLETRNLNGVLSPYCVSVYDGKKISSFYLTDYKDSTELLESSILSIMKRKYNGCRVYLHNFSNFDGIFLLNILINLSDDIKPIINDDKLIDIKFKFANYNLYFRDSYLLLPSSIKDLAKAFNVEKKGIFPILFVNDSNINLNYIGEIPSFRDFVNLKFEEYIEYCNKFKGLNWDLKNEAIKYCNQDVITLHQIISKFSNIIFEEFRLDISNFTTLSSLALGIFRCKFLLDLNIPIITGKMYNDIKDSYTGGNVEVYKPFGKNIYHYDVNSLYPFVMKNYPMPVGEPIYFEGDITNYQDKPFGFFDVIVKAPKFLNIPLLQTKLKLNNYTKTISPVGTWRGFYLSEEIYKAKELKYEIEILRGYIFNKGYIYKEYVNYFYEMKVNSERNSPYFIIAKLLLNSLYGRLGMNPVKEKHVIIKNSESFNIFNNYNVTNVVNLNYNKELISYLDFKEDLEEKDIILNISVPTAAAVTAFARLYMYKFKNLKDTNIYYTDTDSLDINRKLDDSLVGSEIGKLKLEYISNKAIFLAPKVYYCVTNIGDICKIKGFKSPDLNEGGKVINFDDFNDLLFKDNKKILNQEKWYKNISKGNITIKKDIYTLTVTTGKRQIIYDTNNKFIDTKPLNLIDGILE